MVKLINKCKFFFLKGNKRSILVKKNILQTFFIKIFSVPISFLLIPITIHYVDSESYGIWIALSSIVSWMNFFDIGLNNGLRNKLTESIAEENISLSKKYVSTTYAILSLISISIFLIFIGINSFLDWSLIFNIPSKFALELSKVSLIIIGYFSFKFVLSTINTILLSYQLTAQSSFRGLVEQASSLIIIFMLTKFTQGSLLYLALGLCVSPLLILLYYNFSLFYGKFKLISPSFKYVDFSITKDIMGIGLKFFIIQIAAIIQFETANFIIIRSFGPSEVTVYNIAYKYFSVLTMLMSIMILPIWSAVTEAYAKNDFEWIKNIERKYRKIAFGLIGLGIFMLLFSNFAYNLWLGKGVVVIDFETSLLMFLYTIIILLGGVYCTILNGISALDIQYKASFFSPIVFIFFSWFFIKYCNFGINSIIIASILANFNSYILAPLQYIRIFYKKSLFNYKKF